MQNDAYGTVEVPAAPKKSIKRLVACSAALSLALGFATVMEIKILLRVRAESSSRPPRHRRDACSMAWRYRFFSARLSQDARVIAEK